MSGKIRFFSIGGYWLDMIIQCPFDLHLNRHQRQCVFKVIHHRKAICINGVFLVLDFSRKQGGMLLLRWPNLPQMALFHSTLKSRPALVIQRHCSERDNWWMIREQHYDVMTWKRFSPYWPFVRGTSSDRWIAMAKGEWWGAFWFCCFLSA